MRIRGAAQGSTRVRTLFPLFHGWVIVAACSVILAVAYGIQFSYGVFLPAMAADTGWDRTSLSLPFSIYVLVYSVLGAASGWCTDRWGPRLVIGAGGLLFGIGVVMTGQADALWQLFLWLGVVAALGMSAVFVPCSATVVRWFVSRRGLALGVAYSGQGLGNLLIPPLAALLIAAYGWRASYLILGLAGGLLIIICAALLARNPERLGLRADGAGPLPASIGKEAGPECSHPVEPTWTLAMARRAPALWLMITIYIMTWLVAFMPFVHAAPFALDLGISPVHAALAVGLIGAGSLPGRLLTGAASDRLGRLHVLVLGLGLQALAFLGFYYSTGVGLLYVSAFLFGAAFGGTGVLFSALVGDFFGRQAVGTILGFAWSIAAPMAAFGPLVAGHLFDRTGSYSAAFLLGAALNLGALCLVFWLKKPMPPKS
ncbi:MAG: MFS transporter [Pseudomonadota bacterium]